MENLPIEAVERFQKQLTIISMINNENLEEIAAKINECIENDPGAFEEDEMIVQLNEKDEDEDADEIVEDDFQAAPASSVDSSTIHLLEIETRIRSMKSTINEIGSIEKFSSGYYAGKVQGIVIGFVLTLILLLILFWSIRL